MTYQKLSATLLRLTNAAEAISLAKLRNKWHTPTTRGKLLIAASLSWPRVCVYQRNQYGTRR